MTLAQEAESKHKKYEGLNDDDPLVMKISSVPHSEALVVQGQSGQPGKTQHINHIQDVSDLN